MRWRLAMKEVNFTLRQLKSIFEGPIAELWHDGDEIASATLCDLLEILRRYRCLCRDCHADSSERFRQQMQRPRSRLQSN